MALTERDMLLLNFSSVYSSVSSVDENNLRGKIMSSFWHGPIGTVTELRAEPIWTPMKPWVRHDYPPFKDKGKDTKRKCYKMFQKSQPRAGLRATGSGGGLSELQSGMCFLGDFGHIMKTVPQCLHYKMRVIKHHLLQHVTFLRRSHSYLWPVSPWENVWHH